jgi:hypothetical protein
MLYSIRVEARFRDLQDEKSNSKEREIYVQPFPVVAAPSQNTLQDAVTRTDSKLTRISSINLPPQSAFLRLSEVCQF